MATSTAGRGIDCFIAWIFVAHEMWSMSDEIVVAVVGTKIIDDTEVRNGDAGYTDVGRGRWYSGRFGRCRTFYPSLAAEGDRVDGGAFEGATHFCDFGDVPNGKDTVEGGGTIKRGLQTCNSGHIPFAQVTVEGQRTPERVL